MNNINKIKLGLILTAIASIIILCIGYISLQADYIAGSQVKSGIGIEAVVLKSATYTVHPTWDTTNKTATLTWTSSDLTTNQSVYIKETNPYTIRVIRFISDNTSSGNVWMRVYQSNDNTTWYNATEWSSNSVTPGIVSYKYTTTGQPMPYYQNNILNLTFNTSKIGNVSVQVLKEI